MGFVMCEKDFQTLGLRRGPGRGRTYKKLCGLLTGPMTAEEECPGRAFSDLDEFSGIVSENAHEQSCSLQLKRFPAPPRSMTVCCIIPRIQNKLQLVEELRDSMGSDHSVLKLAVPWVC
jgi:hypothetical protein